MIKETTIPEFSHTKAYVRGRFDIMVQRAKSNENVLMCLQYDRDEIWEAYLNGFPEEERQGFNCNTCKSYIRQVGAAVLLDSGLNKTIMWDPSSPCPGVRGIAKYLADKPIEGLFFHDEPNAGVDSNWDSKREVRWTHFHAPIPSNYRNVDNNLGRKSAHLAETKAVLKRGLEGITYDAIDSVLELIAQGSLYRGEENRKAVEFLKEAKNHYMALPEDKRDLKAWHMAATCSEAFCRIRNTSIGTLLVNLSEGQDIEKAVTAFERIVAPTNYKRPKALVTPRMVENAKKKLEELGLLSALDRRRLDTRDLNAENALYVYRPRKSSKDVFETLTEESNTLDIKKLEKVEEIPVEKFISDVLPTAVDMRVLVEDHHLNNFVTMTGPSDPEAPNLMKWDNSFAWSYTGGMADSPIKERVKMAGGNVSGWMRASLSWSNHDDLDLHFTAENKERVYYGNKKGKLAWLDVDMNAGGRMSDEPVENICFPKQLPEGSYTIGVNQYYKRRTQNVGYTLEIEVNGNTFTFSERKNPEDGKTIIYKFKVFEDGNVVFDKSSNSTSGKTKWGVTTGQLRRVLAVTLSPNHWSKPTGNRHFFFMMEGCVSDEQTVPFLNEHLTEKLAAERKVTEALSGKIKVDPAEGVELSGIGFSSTKRDHVYVEVTGKFKRIVKVLF